MALVFAPSANAVLGAVKPSEVGQASGATNTIRELGGVLGVAVLATVCSSAGGYGSPQPVLDGMTAALPDRRRRPGRRCAGRAARAGHRARRRPRRRPRRREAHAAA